MIRLIIYFNFKYYSKLMGYSRLIMFKYVSVNFTSNCVIYLLYFSIILCINHYFIVDRMTSNKLKRILKLEMFTTNVIVYNVNEYLIPSCYSHILLNLVSKKHQFKDSDTLFYRFRITRTDGSITNEELNIAIKVLSQIGPDAFLRLLLSKK